MQSGWEGGIRDLTPREREREDGRAGQWEKRLVWRGLREELGDPRGMEGFQGQSWGLWEEGRGWVCRGGDRGRGSCARSRGKKGGPAGAGCWRSEGRDSLARGQGLLRNAFCGEVNLQKGQV